MSTCKSGTTAQYVGRFAPSPTGPLHAGSLVAALASYLDARHYAGRWLLRIDDIDPPRSSPGADELIPQALRAHGLDWDGHILRQSESSDLYDRALTQLINADLAFYCTCTRRRLGPSGCCMADCANQNHSTDDSSLRVRVPPDTLIEFHDRFMGLQRYPLGEHLPNFIIRRRDGLYAYQLAAAVDDGDGLITDVVRGADLLPSTPRQIYLQRLLGLATPRYAHVPVVCGSDGEKLSKQTGAQPLEAANARHNLLAALAFLAQEQPPEIGQSMAEMVDWSVTHWDPERLIR
ncbi:glutamyl-Q tRNA(Asp) synthetase [Luminiphilus syltensis NOR5-1B]|uniref:Glutamyl-Q tRNA(Asp) synthetase n=1 Tax=Luminiphilus syltensis NOR5-1B TaxID=565045 RepID=B8KRY2_9GAMM|nr:tRNA glutamyl-Q(34) synthetase GluQRS [Luminiphilus syltensis]EED35538.1 glutamyl-Q tRNA(Asp) synthetase [Luminiphilus syltensis NOR5-1B]